jgi:amino acid transporter
MILLRLFVIAFNVAVIAFLIYRMLQVGKQPMERSKKIMVIIGGIILLLAPFGIFLRFFMPTLQYFLIYPVAIALYLYMIREI